MLACFLFHEKRLWWGSLLHRMCAFKKNISNLTKALFCGLKKRYAALFVDMVSAWGFPAHICTHLCQTHTKKTTRPWTRSPKCLNVRFGDTKTLQIREKLVPAVQRSSRQRAARTVSIRNHHIVDINQHLMPTTGYFLTICYHVTNSRAMGQTWSLKTFI